MTDQQKKGFLDRYKPIRPTVQIVKSVESEKHNQIARPIEQTKYAENYTASLNGSESEQDIINRFLEANPLSTGEVSQIEKETTGQSDSRSWKEQSKGRITVSTLKMYAPKLTLLKKLEAL